MEAAAPRTKIEYVGHATVLLDMDGVRLLTDPLLRNRVAHLRRTVKVEHGALRGIDAVLISHLHYDHLDFPSLQRLGRELPLVVPRGAGGLIRRKGRFGDVTEMSPGDEIRIGALTIVATKAAHDASRLPMGTRAEPLGYRVEGTRTLYYAGDTDLFPEMAEIGPVDLALLPIWGWGPTMGPGHMDPAAAAQSLRLLRPRIAIPIHWGTYYPIHLSATGRPAWLDTPPETFRAEAAAVAPATEVRILRPGERTEI